MLDLPISLLSNFLAERRGPHWAFSSAESTALAGATAAVVNEIIPLIPAMDDNPLADAVTRLALALGAVIGTRYMMDLAIARILAEQNAGKAPGEPQTQAIWVPGV